MAVVFSPNIVLSLSAVGYSLNYPRACFENLLIDATLTASDYASEEFAPENVTDGNTFDHWRGVNGTNPAFIEAEFTTAKDVDFLGIAGHNLGTLDTQFLLQYWDTSLGWLNCHDVITPINDDTIMVFFDSVFTQKVRLYITTGPTAPSLAVVYVGQAFVFPQRFFVGFTPVGMDRKTDIQHSISDGGYDLGRSIMRDGMSSTFEIKNLQAAWVRSQLVPVLDAIDTTPFFFAWRPGDYPDEVAFCWIDDDRPSPVNSGPGSLMSVKFNVRGMLGGSPVGYIIAESG